MIIVHFLNFGYMLLDLGKAEKTYTGHKHIAYLWANIAIILTNTAQNRLIIYIFSEKIVKVSLNNIGVR